MGTIKKFRYTFGAFGAVIAAILACFFQEIGVAMSGVMIQLGFCVQGDSLCILWHYVIMAVMLIMPAIVIDLIDRRKSLKKTKGNVHPEKIGAGINRETLEPRQFFILSEHAELIVNNADARVVAKFLLKKYTEIARTTTIGNNIYETNVIEFFDPEKQGTLEYAMVVHGKKITPVHGYFNIGEAVGTIDPKSKSIEMFIVTVSQGGKNTSRVTFDTNTRELFPIFSKWLIKDLEEAFSIRKTKYI